jgi:aryl-alcohol dehydrogenase-like predicted oxidoreductase
MMRAGLTLVGILVLGPWPYFLNRRLQGGTVKGDPVKDIIKTAFDHGVNMFDTAETYEKGQSEREM